MLTVAEARRVESRVSYYTPTATCVYRLFDADQTLLYVGVTMRALTERLTKHAWSKRWWPSVAYVSVEFFDRRYQALDAERKAIRDESPRFNITGVALPLAHVPLTEQPVSVQ